MTLLLKRITESHLLAASMWLVLSLITDSEGFRYFYILCAGFNLGIAAERFLKQ